MTTTVERSRLYGSTDRYTGDVHVYFNYEGQTPVGYSCSEPYLLNGYRNLPVFDGVMKFDISGIPSTGATITALEDVTAGSIPPIYAPRRSGDYLYYRKSTTEFVEYNLSTQTKTPVTLSGANQYQHSWTIDRDRNLYVAVRLTSSPVVHGIRKYSFSGSTESTWLSYSYLDNWGAGYPDEYYDRYWPYNLHIVYINGTPKMWMQTYVNKWDFTTDQHREGMWDVLFNVSTGGSLAAEYNIAVDYTSTSKLYWYANPSYSKIQKKFFYPFHYSQTNRELPMSIIDMENDIIDLKRTAIRTGGYTHYPLGACRGDQNDHWFVAEIYDDTGEFSALDVNVAPATPTYTVEVQGLSDPSNNIILVPNYRGTDTAIERRTGTTHDWFFNGVFKFTGLPSGHGCSQSYKVESNLCPYLEESTNYIWYYSDEAGKLVAMNPNTGAVARTITMTGASEPSVLDNTNIHPLGDRLMVQFTDNTNKRVKYYLVEA